MITIRVSADVGSDRQVVLTLPPEVPVGRSELRAYPRTGNRVNTYEFM